jgi:hypothetical protein
MPQTKRVTIAVKVDNIATLTLAALAPLVFGGLMLEIIADDQAFTQRAKSWSHSVVCISTAGIGNRYRQTV